MSRLFSIDPVGILKACTTNVRMKSARMTAMTIDSKYSRTVDFLNSVIFSLALGLLTPGGKKHRPGANRKIPPGGFTWPLPQRHEAMIFFSPPRYSVSVPILSTARNASCGISTRPTRFIRFLPSFCFSSSFRFREMSPP